MFKGAYFEHRCRGNNLLGEQHYNNGRSPKHSDIPRKAWEDYRLDKVDRLPGIAMRKDAVKI